MNSLEFSSAQNRSCRTWRLSGNVVEVLAGLVELPGRGMPAQGRQVDGVDHVGLGRPAGLAGHARSTSARKLPGLPERASFISSPFIIISAWGIVPWKLVDSSASSLAKAKMNCRSQASRRRLPSSTVPALCADGRRQQRVEELLGAHRLERHRGEEGLVLLAPLAP